MKLLFTIATLLSINFFSSAQSLRNEISVHLGAGIFTDGKLKHVSGNYKLVSTKPEFNFEAGFRKKLPISSKFFLQSGLSFTMHLHYVFNGYSVRNADGTKLKAVEERKEFSDIESFSLFLPIQGGYSVLANKKYKVEFLLGPGLSLYWTQEKYVPNYNRYEGIDDPFFTYQVNFLYKRTEGLYPGVEAESELRAFKYFKRKGKIGAGIVYHLGYHGFEKSTYIIFPSLPGKTSKGELSSGRSYLGLRIYYSFRN